MSNGEAIANFARLSTNASAYDPDIADHERKDRDLMFFARRDSSAQNKAVVTSWHHNMELKRDPKRAR